MDNVHFSLDDHHKAANDAQSFVSLELDPPRSVSIVLARGTLHAHSRCTAV